jgi:hypothetical protein
MHLKTTNPQRFVPRLPQRLVGRYAIQSMQVMQAEAAPDQRAYETTNHASHGAADTGRAANLILRRILVAIVGFGTARSAGSSWRRAAGRR